ncbi:hypothetical protein NO559_11680 [Dasania sp. GY-MA-18]|uniref:Nucleotidyl transferase AbiEii/AbiGii toxin family protein n=1 Tax=Dasania phycosphaerae TaxID=2950436 RepID=A0A9J6RP16_9GAMM|nr:MULTISPECIES: hypothetical protein [Dasania]MCR8923438.1 hypothetical protein [Dasania sp. GY-MA-18]MCZ0865871.1 hypothetical protein [Dasania phycosphaerae]MCZ0869595.1 hypothetical protein [Dasania phycosphaerae]
MNAPVLEDMLATVAKALGDVLLRDVVFVGGCATALLVTDEVTKEAVRYTEDVDLITQVMGYSQWLNLQERLKNRGFSVNQNDDVLCRMRLGDLKVDFMPDDESIFGFSNRWYRSAIASANDVVLSCGCVIRLVAPVHFLATKMEAYKGRGNNDPLSSHDIEDILNVVDGRIELLSEVSNADIKLKQYIAESFSLLLKHPGFDYAVQAAAKNSEQRENIIFKRLEGLAAIC